MFWQQSETHLSCLVPERFGSLRTRLLGPLCSCQFLSHGLHVPVLEVCLLLLSLQLLGKILLQAAQSLLRFCLQESLNQSQVLSNCLKGRSRGLEQSTSPVIGIKSWTGITFGRHSCLLTTYNIIVGSQSKHAYTCIQIQGQIPVSSSLQVGQVSC